MDVLIQSTARRVMAWIEAPKYFNFRVKRWVVIK